MVPTYSQRISTIAGEAHCLTGAVGRGRASTDAVSAAAATLVVAGALTSPLGPSQASMASASHRSASPGSCRAAAARCELLDDGLGSQRRSVRFVGTCRFERKQPLQVLMVRPAGSAPFVRPREFCIESSFRGLLAASTAHKPLSASDVGM